MGENGGQLIFFSIIDDRLGLREGEQDKKILYAFNPKFDFDKLVVAMGHMQTVIGICGNFKTKPKYFRTKKTITFFSTPVEHIHFFLRVTKTDSPDIFLPFMNHLTNLYDVCFVTK